MGIEEGMNTQQHHKGFLVKRDVASQPISHGREDAT